MRNGYEHMKVTAFIAMFPELLTVLQFLREKIFSISLEERIKRKGYKPQAPCSLQLKKVEKSKAQLYLT